MLNPKQVAAALHDSVNAVLIATAFAELERERVDAIQRKIIADMGITCEPSKMWQMADSTWKEYHRRCQDRHLADGYKDAAQGYCPALVAESLQIDAENALIREALRFFPDCTCDALLCGTKTRGGLETRAEYLRLLIGLVVSAPGYRSPLKKVPA